MNESIDLSAAYARLLPPLRAKCRRLLGHSPAAEDVVQEAFLRFLEQGGGGRALDVRIAMAWLYRTSTRLAIDVLRARRRTEAAAADAEALPCGADLQASIAARSTIVALASSATQDELEAAVLCRVDGLPHPEAAAVLGVSERTVRRMLDRFDERTKRLREEIER